MRRTSARICGRARRAIAIACALAALLVAGLAPALPRASRALAEEPGANIVLVDGAEDELEVMDAQTPDGVDSVDEDVVAPPLETDDELDVEVQSTGMSVSNPDVKADSSMTSGQLTTWDCVWFGSYPQSEVAPTDTEYPDLEGASWDANGDATVDGRRYRRISKGDAMYDGYWSDDGYDSATYRYFRYEPVKWRVLKVSGNTALVVADVALDDQKYNTNHTDVTWESSSVRSWLNGYGVSYNEPGTNYTNRNFVGTAFSPEERWAIIQSNVVNANNTDYQTDGGNDTQDEVFLLSEAEVYDASHGFVSNPDTKDEARRCRTSDYAHAMGAWRSNIVGYEGNCWWYLRSPGDRAKFAAGVDDEGNVERYGDSVNDRIDAVRPALNLNLTSSHPQPAGTVSSDGAVTAPLTSASTVVTSYTYDGTAKEPALTVMSGEMVVPASGYDAVYEKNVNVGTATVTVTGKGGYSGTASATFAIAPADLSAAEVGGLAARAYDGGAQTQAPTVVVGGRTLKEGADYKVSYRDNVDAGTATMTVTGRGNYTGTATATFAIKPASLAKAKVTNVKSRTYNGKARTQKPTVKVGSHTLIKGVDYTLSYKDNKRAGTATMTVTGVGNYSGSVTRTFKIAKAKNPIKVKAIKRKAKASKAKKKAQIVARPIKFTKRAKGKVSYKRVKKGSSKRLSVNKKTGKVTVKKGTKKGKYKIRIKVTAAGTANYKKATKTLTCTIVVK